VKTGKGVSISKTKTKKKDVRFWCKLTLIAFAGMVAALTAMALDNQAVPWLLAAAGFMAIFAAGNLRIDALQPPSRKESEVQSVVS